MRSAPKFHQGQTVIAHSTRQGDGIGKRISATTATREVAQVFWKDAWEHRGKTISPEGWHYRLRREGSKSRGGQVHWHESELAETESPR